MNSFQFIFKYVKRHKVRYILGIITLFLVDLFNVYVPRITGAITDGLTANTIDWTGVKKLLLALLILGFFLALGRFFWRYYLFGASRNIEKEIRNDMFAHLETMSTEYFNRNKTGDLMTYFTSDLNAVRLSIGPAIMCIFDAVVWTIMVFAQMIFYVDLRLTLMTLIPMLLICFGTIQYGNVMHVRFREKQDAVSDMTDFVQESFSGVRVIKAFVRERQEFYAFAKENLKVKEKNLRVVKLESIMIPLLDVVIGIATLITLVYGGYLTLMGDITLGRFVAFNQYINMLVWPMLASGEAIRLFSQGSASIKRIQKVFDEQTDIFDHQNVVDIEKMHGEITFDHLTFVHEGQTRPTLEDISLKVPKGTTLAIIGRTGTGKSTLVNLLLHLYNVKRGMLYFDGKDINEISLKTLRENIAYVPQDNFLFSNTIRANIALGVDDEDMDDIIQASKSACIHESIKEFPEGYDTIVGERGVTLSGGQKQRSSIARALLKDSPILILDDSLSAVDTKTEEQILQNLKINRAGKTNIIIAHRISTIQNADIIMVIEEGKAIEIGNHRTLMEQGGLYYDMYQKQQLEKLKEVGEVQ